LCNITLILLQVTAAIYKSVETIVKCSTFLHKILMNKPLITLLFILAFITVTGLKAQNAKIDSLENCLKNHITEDTLKIKLLNKLVANIDLNDIDKAKMYALEALKLANQLKYPKFQAKTLINLSMVETRLGHYEIALDTYKDALKIAEGIDDIALISSCYSGIGGIYSYQGNYPLSLEYFHKYLKISEFRKNKTAISNAQNNIGNIYLLTNDFPKALDYYEKSLKFALENNKKSRISIAYGNIGSVYKKMNDLRSLEYFRKALEISEEIGEHQTTISVYIFLGDVYLYQGNFTKALESYNKALKLSEDTKWMRPICEIYNKRGTVYLKQKQYADALKNTLKALEYANEMKLMDSKNDIHKQLSEIYAFTNDSSKAYLHHKLFTQINDSVYNDKNTKRIAELEYSYKLEKEKHAIQLKQQKKDTIQSAIVISLVVGILLLSMFAIYVYRSLLAKRKTNLILTHQNEKIEKLNGEYKALNEEYIVLNEQLQKYNAEINKELEINQKSMTAATLKLIQNAERDATTIQRLQQIEKYTASEGKIAISSLISDYRRMSYNSNWEEFEILFEKVHGSFYEKINNSFPTLTSNERKMCAFLKLNMSNKDIANITFQSDEALKKARLRLRQKLQIDRETNLSSFMQAV